MSNKTMYYFGGLFAALAALTLSEVCNTSEIIDIEESTKQIEMLIPERYRYEGTLVPNNLVYKHDPNS